eukprot:gnl/TRDRNA2_/TRDRNA2_177764_c0_seq3.p1 gnl/TRDRNA2_/TRDRNA2_177764_c0~~gnl/TRDRNA2_/TRDRNA2_177764_c0_seq3.p1  ORF type:complete len:350 (-),score=-25.10 gnl/TRDRNA2_/TRDRNA2_177764_c0_seq3:632-1681(-)
MNLYKYYFYTTAKYSNNHIFNTDGKLIISSRNLIWYSQTSPRLMILVQLKKIIKKQIATHKPSMQLIMDDGKKYRFHFSNNERLKDVIIFLRNIASHNTLKKSILAPINCDFTTILSKRKEEILGDDIHLLSNYRILVLTKILSNIGFWQVLKIRKKLRLECKHQSNQDNTNYKNYFHTIQNPKMTSLIWKDFGVGRAFIDCSSLKFNRKKLDKCYQMFWTILNKGFQQSNVKHFKTMKQFSLVKKHKKLHKQYLLSKNKMDLELFGLKYTPTRYITCRRYLFDRKNVSSSKKTTISTHLLSNLHRKKIEVAFELLVPLSRRKMNLIWGTIGLKKARMENIRFKIYRKV